jgi:hypothetical protein
VKLLCLRKYIRRGTSYFAVVVAMFTCGLHDGYSTMSMFDYGTAAEFFPTRRWRSARSSFGYKRFARAADAIRFIIEELPPDLLVGAFLEVDEERFDGKGIRRLYDSADYPLRRAAGGRAAERKRGSGAATSKKSRAAEGLGAATSKKASAATSKTSAAHG